MKSIIISQFGVKWDFIHKTSLNWATHWRMTTNINPPCFSYSADSLILSKIAFFYVEIEMCENWNLPTTKQTFRRTHMETPLIFLFDRISFGRLLLTKLYWLHAFVARAFYGRRACVGVWDGFFSFTHTTHIPLSFYIIKTIPPHIPLVHTHTHTHDTYFWLFHFNHHI